MTRFASRAVPGLLALALVPVVLFSSPDSSTGPGRRVQWPSGVFAGYGPAADVRFGEWRGRAVTSATDYLPSQTWAQLQDPVFDLNAWRARRGLHPDFSLALWPASGGTLAAAASGAYDAHFAALARHLVAARLGDVDIRLGWEFNATFYPWSVATPAAAAQFAAAWRQIVTAMRSVPGARFGFVWSPDLQTTGIDPSLAYPGNAYVSDIGLDVYDWNDGPPGESATERWQHLLDARSGLLWQARFARRQDKPLAYPEWGLVSYRPNPALAGGDDPSFVRHMFSWFSDHRVAFEDLFDADDPGQSTYYGITTGTGLFPHAAAVYRRLWGG